MKTDTLTSSNIPNAIAIAPASIADAIELLAARGIEVRGNPDVRILESEELYVDDVRELLRFAALSPLGDRKYALISFSRANSESQNALLKAVEESMGNTTFIFTLESLGYLIPTLRSRVSVMRRASRVPVSVETAREFLDETYQKRIARVDKMSLHASKNQDKREIKEFLRGLLVEARNRRLKAVSQRDVLNASEFLRLQGSSAKIILGHLAVTLPRD